MGTRMGRMGTIIEIGSPHRRRYPGDPLHNAVRPVINRVRAVCCVGVLAYGLNLLVQNARSG